MRHHRLVLAIMLLLSFLVPGATIAQDSNVDGNVVLLHAALRPSGQPDAFGYAKITIDLDTGELCYRLSVARTDVLTEAHLHPGDSGDDGTIVIPLDAATDGLADGCIAVDILRLAPLLADPTSYSIEVHTEALPDGAVRGYLEWLGEPPVIEDLPLGTTGILELVGHVSVHDQEPLLIADLTAFGQYAYLARWGGADCGDPEDTTPDGGAYVIDISDPANPVEVGFIPAPEDTLVGEGMQVVHLDTSAFTGDVLLMNHEGCGPNYQGGVSLWDVTDPLNPEPLAQAFGDLTIFDESKDPPIVNQTHSAFIWTTGESAYLVSIDDEESADVDIFDITDPMNPELVVELDLNAYDVKQLELGLADSFSHDVVVKPIDGRWIMLVSYWDGGFVLLDVSDPAAPEFLFDTDFAAVDPELLEQTGASLTPEGNAHQAEFTVDNQFVIGTDEDFNPYRLNVTIEGATYLAAAATNTTIAQATAFTGTPIFVGLACPADPEAPDMAGVPAAPDDDGTYIAVVERGVCFFEDKALAVQDAGGYDAMVIANREGSDACTGAFGPFLEVEIPTIMIGRDAASAMFGLEFDLEACLDETPEELPLEVGTVGSPITEIISIFDGWGYVHLFDLDLSESSVSLTELDTFAIPEAMDPAFAEGFGDLSVHEVATDPTDPDLAYLSYYGGGVRVIQIQCADPADTTTCELVEVGSFVEPFGSNFWGIEVWTHPDTGEEYILGSDMDDGLWIFQIP